MMINVEEAYEIACNFIKGTGLQITNYRDFDDKYIFTYEFSDGSPSFDNCMVEVNKKDKRAQYYVISKHLDELKKEDARPCNFALSKLDTE